MDTHSSDVPSTSTNASTTTDIHHDSHEQLHLPVDIEHGGIRLAGCMAFVVSGIIFAFIGITLFAEGSLLVIVISLLLASGATYLVDMSLKGRWLSGRELISNETVIQLQTNSEAEKTIQRALHSNVLLWYFVVQRTGRVKKGWYVVACALEQDGVHLPVYTFCSPEAFNAFEHKTRFTHLERRPTLSDKKDMKLAGERRRLQDAEQVRGMEGGELTFEHFQQFMTYLLEQTNWVE